MEGRSRGLIEVLSHFDWGLRKTRKTLRLAGVQAEIKTERLYATACCCLGSCIRFGFYVRLCQLREVKKLIDTFPLILWNLKIHDRVHKSAPLVRCQWVPCRPGVARPQAMDVGDGLSQSSYALEEIRTLRLLGYVSVIVFCRKIKWWNVNIKT